jgi:predicted ATPase
MGTGALGRVVPSPWTTRAGQIMDLLERDGCLHQLEAALADALGNHGRVALVSGEAGIGKTALIRRFVECPAAASARVMWGNCDAQFTPRPLGPLHDIADELDGPMPRLLASNADRSSVFSALLDELFRRQTIAVFEDVHWADEATLDLLGFLARRLGRCATLLVLTFRDDELGLRHPLRLLLGDLAASTLVRRISLPSLSEDAVRVLVGERAINAALLHRRTGGNPFFVTEVLAGDESGLPPTVRDAVLARAARLSTGAQVVLQAAAMGSTDTSSVDECLALGMLVGHADTLGFRHELARQAILETISPARRVELHRHALRVLRTIPSARQEPARLARYAEGAGDCAAILEYATVAGRQAAAATAHHQAGTLYGLALGCADDLPPAASGTAGGVFVGVQRHRPAL